MSSPVFVCQVCGNLHGAPVAACGMCGSPAVALQADSGGTPTAAPGSELSELVRKASALCDLLAELAQAMLANLPKRDTQPPPAP